MGYPAPGYRSGASRYNGGFQRPSSGNSPWKPSGPPANDNTPRYGTGTPANDNAPSRKSNSSGSAKKSPFKGTPGQLAKGLAKGLGPLAAGYAAYELWNWYNSANSPLEHIANMANPQGYTPYRVGCFAGNLPHNRSQWAWRGGLSANDPVCSAGVFVNIVNYSNAGFAEGRPYVGFVTKSNINTKWFPYSWTKTGTHNPGTQIAGDYGAWYFPTPTPPTLPSTPALPTLPQIYPELDPSALPIRPHHPWPFPKPLPIRYPGRPAQDPTDPYSPRRQQPRRQVRPRSRSKPSVIPAQITVVTPNSVTSGRGGHPLRPRQQERKTILNPHAASAVGIAISSASEAGDLIEAFHDALPERCKRHQPGNFFDAIAIANCWDHLDLRQALKNLVANEIDDRLYGKLGRRQARANREQGRPRSNPRIGPARGDLPSLGEAVADFLFGAD